MPRASSSTSTRAERLVDLGPGAFRTPRCVVRGRDAARPGAEAPRPADSVADAVDLGGGVVDDLAVERRHRLERLGTAGLEHLLGDAPGELLERLAALGAVAGDVDVDAHAVPVGLALDDRPHELLDRVERRALRARRAARGSHR